jgi:hypothetical protein
MIAAVKNRVVKGVAELRPARRYHTERQKIEEDVMAKGNNARKKETKKPKKDKK